jgi:hypothetical protein
MTDNEKPMHFIPDKENEKPTLCGYAGFSYYGVNMTADREDVTCKFCLKILQKRVEREISPKIEEQVKPKVWTLQKIKYYLEYIQRMHTDEEQEEDFKMTFISLEDYQKTAQLVRDECEKEIKSFKSAFNECLEDNGKMFKRLKKYEEWTGRKL